MLSLLMLLSVRRMDLLFDLCLFSGNLLLLTSISILRDFFRSIFYILVDAVLALDLIL